jgi:hypothetical protein
MMNLKNLQKEFASKQLLKNEDMAMLKGGLASSNYSTTSSITTASVTSVTSDDKRRERPGGGIG